MKKHLHITSLISILAVFIVFGSLAFENVSGNRLFIILGLLLAFIIVNHMKFQWNHLLVPGLLLEIILIYYLEVESRYLINYFLHTLYILVLADAALNLSLKKAMVVQGITLLVSNYKYWLLIGFQSTFANITEFGFFMMLNVIIAIALDFIVTFRNQKAETDELYKELVKSQDQLASMATIEERNRIAREIHDSLGHDMTGLIMQLEMVNHLWTVNPEGAKETLEKAIDGGRKSLNAVRRVVDTLDEENFDLQALVEDFMKNTGVEVVCSNYKINDFGGEIAKTLYRVVQEALTNALKHGEASEVKVDITFDEEMVRILIRDNGKGSNNFEKGFGLKSMSKRVESIGGKIHFSSADGFEINGHIVREK